VSSTIVPPPPPTLLPCPPHPCHVTTSPPTVGQAAVPGSSSITRVGHIPPLLDNPAFLPIILHHRPLPPAPSPSCRAARFPPSLHRPALPCPAHAHAGPGYRSQGRAVRLHFRYLKFSQAKKIGFRTANGCANHESGSF
jgi:hypothetical protein